MDITATIQIGNTDDKLGQRQWSKFVEGVAYLAHDYGKLHFNGHSAPSAMWQNACWVVVMDEDALPEMRLDLAQMARVYGQDSIALTVGVTEFVEAT